SRCGNEPLLPRGTLELQGKLLNTRVGQYLTEHPFLALVVLVFGLTASVPIGLFLAFAAVTFIAVTGCFIFVESK
uniref:Uncharacterized protein n=1 Tax=Pygocentrus nattereri TaxID=42514 RepID=A0A3B4D558_PYGNA